MLKAKVADTPYTLSQGLMYVTNLPEDRGMLFVFKRADNLSFWGMNTFIPLDIAFVDSTLTIRKIASIKPHSLDAIKSDIKCHMAIEANAGYFAENSVSEGDKVVIDDGFSKGDVHISFVKTSKDSASKQGNTKESQVGGSVGVVPTTPKPQVGAPNPGEPIPGTPQADQAAPQEDLNLPTLGPDDIGQYLEDGFDEQEQEVQDGLDGKLDQEPQPDTTDSPQEQSEYPVFSNVFEAMDWAEKNNEVVRINYTTKHGRALVRDVEPHGSFHAESTKRVILVTYDETVGAIRGFIMSNISNWAFVGKQFQKKFIVKA